jgi:hypothetical protein
MRKFLFLLGFIGIAGISSVSAQLGWGVKAGVSYGMVSSNMDNDQTKGSAGFEFGPTAHYILSEKVFINSGLLLNAKGMASGDAGMSLLYLDVPIYAGYAFGIGKTTFYAQAGPVLEMNLSASSNYEGKTTDMKENISPFNAGLGVAFGTNIEKFKIELGYQQGLMNIYKDSPDYSVKLSSISLGVCYVF